ncbi:hypothetical protein LY76DRAFT_605305 [Colletotrichum caudatum]|nr:hypothetical protein LY76DRAFT_605305 [Colletotrichum caudatum]
MAGCFRDVTEDNAICLLRFLAYTERPLNVSEAVEVLVTDTRTQQTGFDKESRVLGENEVPGHRPSLIPGVVKLALEKLTDCGAESTILNDARHVAHNSGFGDVVKVLLKRVADATTEGNVRGLALEIVSKRGHSDLVKLFLERVSEIRKYDTLLALNQNDGKTSPGSGSKIQSAGGEQDPFSPEQSYEFQGGSPWSKSRSYLR